MEKYSNGVAIYRLSDFKEGDISIGQPIVFDVVREIPKSLNLANEHQEFIELIKTSPSAYKLSFHHWLSQKGVISAPVVTELANEAKTVEELEDRMSIFGITLLQVDNDFGVIFTTPPE